MTWEKHIDEFVCHRCGNCCKGEGYVWLTKKDIKAIAKLLDLTTERFCELYTLLAEGGIALKWRPFGDKPCIFYEDGLGCRVQDAKPKQCRDFPFKWRDETSLSYCKGLQALADKYDFPPKG